MCLDVTVLGYLVAAISPDVGIANGLIPAYIGSLVFFTGACVCLVAFTEHRVAHYDMQRHDLTRRVHVDIISRSAASIR